MKSLSEILNLSRTNRPDEWSMDDFSRMASVLEKRIVELDNELSEAIEIIEHSGVDYDEVLEAIRGEQ